MSTVKYPKVGEVFELTLDSERPDVQPLAMLKSSGYPPAGWKYKGKTMAGILTRRFQLVSVGLASNWRDLSDKLLVYGESPAGMWIKAFMDAYPNPDGHGRIGILDDAWQDPKYYACFPSIYSSGILYFSQTLRKFSEHWRWLVYAKQH